MNSLDNAYKLYKERNFESTIPLFEKHLLIEPNDIKAIYHLAISYRRLNDHIKSLELLERCLRLTPEDMDIVSERGVSKFHLKDNAGALEDMNICVENEPKNPYRYSCRAYIRANMNDNNGAIQDYEIAVELAPDDPITHNNLGMLLEKVGRMNQAKKRFKKADEMAGIDTSKVISNTDNEIKPQVTEKSEPNPLPKIENTASTETKPSAPKPKVSIEKYVETLKFVFGSKEGRQEFFKFLKGNKKDNQ